MPGADRIAQVTSEWVAKAESDFKSAVHLLKLGVACPTDVVAFHAQQTVEKYIKAFLTHKQIDFPKTHDISKLLALARSPDLATMDIAEQRRLTSYAALARYPGWGEIPLSQARQAVALARRVRREVRRLLPRKALRRRKQ